MDVPVNPSGKVKSKKWMNVKSSFFLFIFAQLI